MFSFTSKYSSYSYLFNTGIFNLLCKFFINILVNITNKFSSIRVNYTFNCVMTFDSVSKMNFNFISFLNCCIFNTIDCLTVFFVYYNILSNINKTTCHITGIGSLKSCIRKTLTSSVCRNEVFDYRKTFAEVMFNWEFNNISIRLSHQTTHCGKLRNLSTRTTGTRCSHHVNSIKSILISLQTIHHNICKLIICTSPNSTYTVISFFCCNITLRVLFDDIINFFFRFTNHFVLDFWNLNIIHTNCCTVECRILISNILNCIMHLNCNPRTFCLINMFNHSLQRLIEHLTVYIINLFRHCFVESKTTGRSLNNITLLESLSSVYKFSITLSFKSASSK